MNRGRKWNPLRQRLDSYDYTVEQHVVGSLLFTPVLVLLPTTSIFYIFFSMLSTAVICLCILLEITVSIIHSTPYAELIMWVARRQRFPTGLFFHPVMWSSVSAVDGDGLLSTKGYRKTEHLVLGKSEPLVSELCCNYATFGKHFCLPFLLMQYMVRSSTWIKYFQVCWSVIWFEHLDLFIYSMRKKEKHAFGNILIIFWKNQHIFSPFTMLLFIVVIFELT